jgi:hypothetical protein
MKEFDIDGTVPVLCHYMSAAQEQNIFLFDQKKFQKSC